MLKQENLQEVSMLMERHCTDEIRKQLEEVKTLDGWTLAKAIQSGIDNPDSSIGVYAGSSASYDAFAPLFDRIIADYHNYDMSGHRSDFSLEGLPTNNLDPEENYIVSTRIRVGRNFAKFAFPSAITASDRAQLESEVVEVLKNLPHTLSGNYYPLDGMSEAIRQQLVEDHFLFKQGDRFLESAGVNRDWPKNRGIFFSNDKKFLTWVSEEDSLRIISMQQGADLATVFNRLATALEAINERIEFAYDTVRGYHTTCPTNLGTAMRASVHIKLPKFSERENFKAICGSLGLSVRGVHGEHSESKNGIYDISNKQRLGISEREIYEKLYRGIKKLIEIESNL